MSDTATGRRGTTLVLEYELDASPETVWRALSLPAFRERWLPARDLTGAEPVAAVPGREVSYKMRDDEPPFLDSLVTFRIRPAQDGGTVLRIVHGLTDARLNPPARQTPPLANDNGGWLMRAA